MKTCLLIILMLLNLGAFSQNKKWFQPLFDKTEEIILPLQSLSGYSDGCREEILYHPVQLFKICPNLNRQYFDIRVSWRNKYNESPLLVAFSDGNHLTKATSFMLNISCIAITNRDFSVYKKSEIWKVILFRLVKSYLANKAGFYLSYNLQFKNH